MKHQRPGRRAIPFAVVLLAGLLIACVAAQAQGIKARMLARLPQIESMKSSGILGEDKNGYLAFVGKEKKNEEVLNILTTYVEISIDLIHRNSG